MPGEMTVRRPIGSPLEPASLAAGGVRVGADDDGRPVLDLVGAGLRIDLMRLAAALDRHGGGIVAPLPGERPAPDDPESPAPGTT